MNLFSYFRKFTLKTQIFIFITILFLSGIITISWSTFYIQNRYFDEALRNNLNSLKYSTLSAIYPLLITQDYDRIERFLHHLTFNKDIISIRFIDKNKRLLIELKKTANRNVNISYPLKMFNQHLFEYLTEDDNNFYLLFPIKNEFTQEILAWLQIVLSKKFIKDLQKRSFFTNLFLLISGWLIVLLFVYIIFSFYTKDLQEFQSFLGKIPYEKGLKLKRPLFSKDLEDLKNIGNRISQILLFQEKNLHYEKVKIERILTFFSEGIVLTDTNFQIQYANPFFCFLIKYNCENIINQRLPEVFPLLKPNENSPLWDDPLLELLKQRSLLIDQSLKIEGIFISPDKEKRFIELSCSPIVWEEKIEGFIFGISDITKRKQIEQEMIKIEKFETINRLAGGVAHDLNNMLSILFNYLNLVKLNIDKNKKEDSIIFIEKTEKVLHRAKHLALQLLSLSKEGVPVKEPHDLEELIQEVAEFCFSGTPIRYHLKLFHPVKDILIDPQQMAQVFQNIFINAREAMPEGGEVRIEINLKKLKDEEIPPLLKGEYVEIKISDTGPGIPADILPQIFEPFFTTKQGGTGLGLAIVYQIIKNHGGNIIAENNPEGGATFKIYLPFFTEKKSLLPKEVSIPSESTPKPCRILIIDDEEELRETLKILLSEAGYETETAGTGKEGIDRYYEALKENKPFHLVITDYILPDLTGDKILAELKSINPEIKVILSTGYTGMEIISDYKNYGFSGLLIKPYMLETLIQTIHKSLSSSS